MFDLALYAIALITVFLLAGRDKAATSPKVTTIKESSEVEQSPTTEALAEASTQEPVEPALSVESLQLLSVAALRDLARSKGLKTRHNRNKRFNKTELIAVLVG